MSARKKIFLLIASILFIDQLSKILVKLNMSLGDHINVIGNWFIILFTENPGMAFGLELGGEKGKLILSLFRIAASLIILFLIIKSLRKKELFSLSFSLALIFAGAMSNIIDCTFYGLLFSDSLSKAAVFLPSEGGYASILSGHVVDMLYFPIIKTTYPSWFPVFSGKEFIFFRPIFNLADASICIGLFNMILFQKKKFKDLIYTL